MNVIHRTGHVINPITDGERYIYRTRCVIYVIYLAWTVDVINAISDSARYISDSARYISDINH